MRVKDYPLIEAYDPSDVLLLDGNNGVRSITPESIREAYLKRTQTDEYYKILDQVLPNVSARRNAYRGKNIGGGYRQAVGRNRTENISRFIYWRLLEN